MWLRICAYDILLSTGALEERWQCMAQEQRWRWDQGRLEYFRFESLVTIARALVDLEGTVFESGTDPLKAPLSASTGLPFSAASHALWRNYGRVFKCALLATNHSGKLVCTDTAHKLSEGAHRLSADEYLANVTHRFSYPSPAFVGYKATDDRVFPFCALLKFLMSRLGRADHPSISVDEVFRYLVGNGVDGTEDVTHYQRLTATSYTPRGDEKRQLRELLRFISQFHFLQWHESQLHLDPPNSDSGLEQLEAIATPVLEPSVEGAPNELLRMGRVTGLPQSISATRFRIVDSDQQFTEGNARRVSHLRYERSARLRHMFFQASPAPYVCDMCSLNVSDRYPWTKNLLELHHLLPLSSPLRTTADSTSLSDLVGVCPTCHRSVHAYYRKWLTGAQLDDFASEDEARHVYQQSKQELN
jgi:hypothetical protein